MATTPDNRPWAPHPIPSWIIKEFIRRQNDIGLDYPVPVSINWDDNGNWQNYKGPMTAWARVFSNGTGRVSGKSDFPIRNGFILHGGDGFDKSYGITDNRNVLGYDSEGVEHVLNVSGDGNFVTFPNSISSENRTVQKFLPVPGITSIDAVIQKERIRKVTVNWRCYGFAQLEYMTPYFLSPKISAFVEFGWNHFNPVSLLDLRDSNLNNLKELFTNSGSLLYNQNIRESYGLYDVTMGIISGFDFTSQDGITYECKTEILSKHANYSGVMINNSATVSSDDKKISVQSKFSDYLEKRLTKLPDCIIKQKNFMDALDETEISGLQKGTFLSHTFPFYKFNDGQYVNWDDLKRTEDRIFFGRRSDSGYEDNQMMSGMAEYDWDAKDQKDVWVTMGFIVELTNVFFNKDLNIELKNAKSYSLYEIDIDDVKIGAHPNLISCDGTVLLIPNQKAPKYNLGTTFPIGNPDDIDYQKQILDVSPNKPLYFTSNVGFSISSSLCDRTLFKIFRTGYKPFDETYNPNNLIALTKDTVSTAFSDTVGFNPLLTIGKLIATKISGRNDEEKQSSNQSPLEKRAKKKISFNIFRDDLDGIINRFRYSNYDAPGTRSFPQWIDDSENGKKAGYWGYLKDLYVNTKVLIECAKSAETVESFYNLLLGKINTAAAKIWELSIVDDAEDSGKLRIVDKKYIQYNKMKIYQFDVGASNSFIKNINFTAQLSNVAANQVISSASTNKTSVGNSPNGDVNSNQIMSFPYGDRFYKDTLIKPRKIDENLEIIKQLQSNPQSSTATKGSYIMSFKSYKNNNFKPQTQQQIAAATAAARAGGGGAGASGAFNPGTDEVTGWNIVNLVLPNDSLLIALMNDMDFTNNTNIYGGQQPGFTVEMTLQGISGLRTFQLFSLKNLPSPYSEREIIFQIVDVSHKVDAGNWTTTIKAGIRSIRGQSISFTTDGINEYSINIIK
jgi:hypothetical protein